MKIYTITTDDVRFSITVEFPDADVDATLYESFNSGGSGFIPLILCNRDKAYKIEGDGTPTTGSIEACIAAIYKDEDNEFEALGIDLVETCSLIMGRFSVTFEIPFENFNKEVVEQTHEIINNIIKENVIYYETETQI